MPYGGRGQQIFDNRALVLKKHGSWERVLSIKITFESSSTNLFILNFNFFFQKGNLGPKQWRLDPDWAPQ